MSEKAYLGHNSPFDLLIKDPYGTVYTAVQMATITRVYLKYIPIKGSTPEYVDSDEAEHSAVFDWITLATDGKLIIDVGLIALTAGHDLTCEVVVYDSTYTSGRVFQIDLQVSDESDDDFEGADALTVIPVGTSMTPTPVTKTATGAIVVNELNDVIWADSVTDIELTLPVMTEDYDGYFAHVFICNIGDVTLIGNTDAVGQTDHTRIKGEDRYSNIILRYRFADLMWYIEDGRGSWGTSA